MSLKNKVVVVAGAGGGMGKEIVRTLLLEEAKVVACDLHIDSLEGLQQDNLLIIQANLLEEKEVEQVFSTAMNTFGKVYGLVNAAGIAQSATPIEEISIEQFHKIMDINMTMPFLMCREAVKYMKGMRTGAIVNIGSVSTTRPRPGLQSYVASKGALESFSKALALEVASYKINVNVLHPGPCDTNMLAEFAGKGADIEEVKEKVFKNSVPLGELLKPEDIAKSVKFLLSEEASMITGAVLHVDGGRSI